MTKTDTEFYDKYTTEYNQVLLKELQAKEDTGGLLPEDMCSFGGCMYETFGEELEYVRKQPTNRIWTIVDTDGDDLIILAGFHIVNRLGYLITDEEWSDEYEEYLID
jgi:hypothetical protein